MENMENLLLSYLSILQSLIHKENENPTLSIERKKSLNVEKNALLSLIGKWTSLPKTEQIIPFHAIDEPFKIPSFVISLPKRSDRRIQFQKDISHPLSPLLDIRTMNAINGQFLPVHNKLYRQWVGDWNYKHLPSKQLHGVVGTAISHLKCFRFMIDHSIPYMLIFEDDATFRSNKYRQKFMSEIRHIIQHLPSTFSILYLNHWNTPRTTYNELFDSIPGSTAEAYIIHLSFATELYHFHMKKGSLGAIDKHMEICRNETNHPPFLVVKDPYFIQRDRRDSDIR